MTHDGEPQRGQRTVMILLSPEMKAARTPKDRDDMKAWSKHVNTEEERQAG